MRSCRPGGHLLGRHRPEPHDDPLVHRQFPPHVGDGEHPVQAGVGHEDHPGVRGGVERREHPAGLRREHVAQSSARRAIRSQAAGAQPGDGPQPPARGEVAALREDHEGVVVVQAGRPAARSARSVSGPLRPGAMNRLGSRLSSTSIAGSHCRVSLSTIRGSRSNQLTSAWIRMNESPGPGVPAEHQLRAAGQRGVRVGADHVDAQPQRPAGLPEQHPQEPAGEHVVRPLEGRASGASSRTRRRSRATKQREQRGGVPDQVDDSQPEQPQRAQPAGDQRRERPRRAAARPAAWSPRTTASSDHRRGEHAAGAASGAAAASALHAASSR